MIDFVLESQRFKEDSDTAIFKVTNYANFLKQPLNLGMFIPCDEDGNVLKEPEENDTIYDIEVERDIYECDYNRFDNDVFLYKQAKERVLFEGFEVKSHTMVVTIYDNEKYLNWEVTDKHFMFYSGFDVERLVQDLNLTLTKSAIEALDL
jgi:hypothetical protein